MKRCYLHVSIQSTNVYDVNKAGVVPVEYVSQ